MKTMVWATYTFHITHTGNLSDLVYSLLAFLDILKLKKTRVVLILQTSLVVSNQSIVGYNATKLLRLTSISSKISLSLAKWQLLRDVT